MIKELIDFEDLNIRYHCSAWVATAIVGAGVIGAASTAYAASKAADAQTSAANTASQTQLALGKQSTDLLSSQYNQTRSDLLPYNTAGQAAQSDLQSRLPFLTSPITMDQATLEQTPGYQFNKTQGLKAVQNSAAARGLGVSGAALKGAATFATSLADSTYQNQFNNENTNRQNAYDRLMGVIGTGENAAAMTGNIGSKAATTAAGVNTTVGGQVGGNTIGAGNANAAAYNATGQAFGTAANNIGGYAAYKGLYGSTSGQGSPSFVTGGAGDQPVLTF